VHGAVHAGRAQGRGRGILPALPSWQAAVVAWLVMVPPFYVDVRSRLWLPAKQPGKLLCSPYPLLC